MMNQTKTNGMAEDKIMSDTIEKGRDLFSKALDSSEKAFETAYGQAKESLDSAVDSSTTVIKKYPLQSLLIGFGIGCVLGFTIKASR